MTNKKIFNYWYECLDVYFIYVNLQFLNLFSMLQEMIKCLFFHNYSQIIC